MSLTSAEPRLTEKEGKYLVFVYRNQHELSGRVKTTSLANAFGVRPATVTEMLQKLAEKGLLKYTPYHGIELTGEGIAEARSLLRKHRLLEVLFVSALNCDIRSACGEASRLDYHVSEELVDDISRTYGHPRTCPCNKPIFSDRGRVGGYRRGTEGR
jgi:DtxR family Mn-dependent transcriptional regulator